MQPHRVEYWEHPNIDNWEEFEASVEELCDLNSQAQTLLEEGIHVVSTDEKTGIQALERLAPTMPMRTKECEKQEFNYKRHGTQALIGNLEIATGKSICPTIGATRTEVDFVNHIQQTIQSDPSGKWIFIVDQLNTHKSEKLVKLVAQNIGDEQDLGLKGKLGILKSMNSRKEYLESKEHRVRFVYVPKHCSWLNLIESFFSALSKRVLIRGNFTSQADLRQKILNYIQYYNTNLASVFDWRIAKRDDVKKLIDTVKRYVEKFMR